MNCDAWMKDHSAKCLYWGLILVLLIIVWWSLKNSEHMGEWSSALVNQNNHERNAAGMPMIDNGGQEWSDVLSNQSAHAKSAVERFAGRRASNTDSREDELMGRLSGGDPWRS